MQTIRVYHEYFEGPWQGISIRPDENSKELIRKHQIIFRETVDGFIIGAADSNNMPENPLVFFCFPTNAEYVYFTDLPPRGTIMYFRCGDEAEAVDELTTPLETNKEIQAHQPPCFLIELSLSLQDLHYTIKLKTKELRWKYILFSASTYPELEIIDTMGKNAPMVFEKSPDSLCEPTASWITKDRIALRAQPAERFQLREVKSGKVVMKRLPCANGKMLVKEKGAEGKEFPAAEVYINP